MRLLYSHFVIGKTLPVVIGAVLALSCGRSAGVYAAPEQRSLDLGPDPGGMGSFVKMDDPMAEDYIVKDISTERGLRRWTFLYPELRFRMKEVRRLTFTAEFAIPEVTYKVTGPVTVWCAVDGKSLGSIRCDHAGDFRLEKPVPAGWIEPGAEVRVTFEAHPRWTSAEDGAQLSFLLRSAGFTQ